jgi:hypothetical protein
MRRRALIALVLTLVAACGGGSPTRPGVETIDRANVVSDRLDTREADLERMIDEPGG